MNKYVKVFLVTAVVLGLGFLTYAAYDVYQNIGMEGVTNLIDFILHGK